MFHAIFALALLANLEIRGSDVIADGSRLTGVAVTAPTVCDAFIKTHVGKYSIRKVGKEHYLAYEDKGQYYDDSIAWYGRKPIRVLNEELIRIGCAKLSNEKFSQRTAYSLIVARPGLYPDLSDEPVRFPTHVPADRRKPSDPLFYKTIQAVVLSHLDSIRYCYSKVLLRHPKLGGSLIVNFDIAQGGVGRAYIEKRTFKDSELEMCILKQVSRWKFPYDGPSPLNISYPFEFTPRGPREKWGDLPLPREDQLMLPPERIEPL